MLYLGHGERELLVLVRIVLGGANNVATWPCGRFSDADPGDLVVGVILGGLRSVDRVPAQRV